MSAGLRNVYLFRINRQSEELRAFRCSFPNHHRIRADFLSVEADRKKIGLNAHPVGLNREKIGANGRNVGVNREMIGTNGTTVGLNQEKIRPDRKKVGLNPVFVGLDERIIEASPSPVSPNYKRAATDRVIISLNKNTIETKSPNSHLCGKYNSKQCARSKQADKQGFPEFDRDGSSCRLATSCC